MGSPKVAVQHFYDNLVARDLDRNIFNALSLGSQLQVARLLVSLGIQTKNNYLQMTTDMTTDMTTEVTTEMTTDCKILLGSLARPRAWQLVQAVACKRNVINQIHCTASKSSPSPKFLCRFISLTNQHPCCSCLPYQQLLISPMQ